MQSQQIQQAIRNWCKSRNPRAYDLLLNSREQLFVDYWIMSADAKHAAIKAGYKATYAKQYGYEMLNKPKIRLAIRERLIEIAGRDVVSIHTKY